MNIVLTTETSVDGLSIPAGEYAITLTAQTQPKTIVLSRRDVIAMVSFQVGDTLDNRISLGIPEAQGA